MDEVWRILKPGGRALITYPRRRASSAGMRGLGIPPSRWEELVRRRPWRSLPVPSGWLVARHLLEKPTAPPDV